MIASSGPLSSTERALNLSPRRQKRNRRAERAEGKRLNIDPAIFSGEFGRLQEELSLCWESGGVIACRVCRQIWKEGNKKDPFDAARKSCMRQFLVSVHPPEVMKEGGDCLRRMKAKDRKPVETAIKNHLCKVGEMGQS